MGHYPVLPGVIAVGEEALCPSGTATMYLF
jgi:hypothetical protein